MTQYRVSTHWVIAILIVVVVLMLVIFVVMPWLTRRRALRKGRLPAAEAANAREKLLEAVQEASTEPGMQISLPGFWKGTRYNGAQRLYILDPLLKKGILTPAQSSDHVITFGQEVRRIFGRSPRSVVLNTRDWTRMAAGAPPSVVIQGDNHGVVQAGGRSNTGLVLQPSGSDDLANVIGNVNWLIGELRKAGAADQDIDDLQMQLQTAPPDQHRQVAEAWQRRVVGRAFEIGGQVTAGILANILTPILARFLGIG